MIGRALLAWPVAFVVGMAIAVVGRVAELSGFGFVVFGIMLGAGAMYATLAPDVRDSWE